MYDQVRDDMQSFVMKLNERGSFLSTEDNSFGHFRHITSDTNAFVPLNVPGSPPHRLRPSGLTDEDSYGSVLDLEVALDNAIPSSEEEQQEVVDRFQKLDIQPVRAHASPNTIRTELEPIAEQHQRHPSPEIPRQRRPVSRKKSSMRKSCEMLRGLEGPYPLCRLDKYDEPKVTAVEPEEYVRKMDETVDRVINCNMEYHFQRLFSDSLRLSGRTRMNLPTDKLSILRPDGFRRFCSGLLNIWLVDMIGEDATWESIEDILSLPDVPMWKESPESSEYDCIQYGKAIMRTFSSEIKTYFQENYGESGAKTICQSIMNFDLDEEGVEPCICLTPALEPNFGMFACALTGRIIPDDCVTGNDQVMHVFVPASQDGDSGNDKSMFCILLDGYSVQERQTLARFVQACYALNNMECHSPITFHNDFIRVFFGKDNDMPSWEDAEMEQRVTAIRACVRAHWGLENHSGLRRLYDLYSRYVIALMLVDHILTTCDVRFDPEGRWKYIGHSWTEAEETSSSSAPSDSKEKEDVDLPTSEESTVAPSFFSSSEVSSTFPSPVLSVNDGQSSGVTNGRKEEGEKEDEEQTPLLEDMLPVMHMTQDLVALADRATRVRKRLKYTQSHFQHVPTMDTILESLGGDSLRAVAEQMHPLVRVLWSEQVKFNQSGET